MPILATHSSTRSLHSTRKRKSGYIWNKRLLYKKIHGNYRENQDISGVKDCFVQMKLLIRSLLDKMIDGHYQNNPEFQIINNYVATITWWLTDNWQLSTRITLYALIFNFNVAPFSV